MNPLLILQLLGPLLSNLAKPAPAEQAGAPPAGIDSSVLAAILAASHPPPEPVLQPQPLPGVVSVLAVGLPAATLIAMISMAVVIAVGGSIGEQQTALLIALSICLGALIVLSATAVNFLLGSSLGSWTKNFRPVAPTVALPPAQPPSEPVVLPPSPEQPEPPAQRPPVDENIGRSTDPSTAALRSDVPYDGRPASIRYCNPGAQYPSQRAAAFGQTGYGLIGGGHKIARFPHNVNGAAANFDLLSRSYTGMTVAEAGDKWTGGNGHGIPGYDDGTVLTKEMIANPAKAIPIMRAIAEREAGKRGTLTDEQWAQAHAMFLAGSADAWLGAARPPQQRTQDLAAAIVAAMKRKGYVLSTGAGEVNIVYVEGLNPDGTINDDAADKWNDLRVVIGFEGDKPVILGKWIATTEPGRYYTDNPVNPGGAARIEFGQYTAWRVGMHRGDHEALVQRGNVTVVRDLNKDMIRPGDARDTGDNFGINQHGPSGVDEAGETVGKFSAGCLVGKSMAEHRAFMAIVKADPRFVADPEYLFRTAILAERDVVQA